MQIWYSSDPHFYHENILRFTIACPVCRGRRGGCAECGDQGRILMRPFDTIDQMHEMIIEAHNARVRPQDHWWCLGDVTMDRTPHAGHFRVLSRMNGHKRLILGNHDHWPVGEYVRAGFQKVKASHKHDRFLFTHYPVHPASIPAGLVNVHGHVHSNAAPQGRYLNISLEVTGYAPVSLDDMQVKAAALPSEACVCPTSPCPRHGYAEADRWPRMPGQ